MGQIHFIGGEKGGVNPSPRVYWRSILLIGATFLGFDLDVSHGTFSRFMVIYPRT